MTLLVFAKGRDGFVIISDRKESDVMGLENDVTKYCLPKNKEFFLSLAGNGTRAESLFARLAKPDVKSINIISTIKDFIRATYAESQEIQYVD
ncbi:MAG: hypothetical protein OXC46_11580 [Thaumarchaeota archaeon]|nr:hypothetical protein [Nitrososphaerota archaeon]